MKQTKIIAAAVLAATAIPTVAIAVVPAMYEERVARAEEDRIIQSPIGGIQTKYWFNYRANVNETQKELTSDLRGASDIEDQRDAWEEYGSELRHERGTYVKAMAKKGYRVPSVYIEGM
ncbi:hypothetical protein [Novosphingobium sp. P6W]|uniref:hypothetical protein n=1 Tax=Novosphingobium sp. P6W TaxID=1609758 RepID=UPI0005C3164E|nr:hypothetical protein [Novosphingobium sp. P6W]AXB76832.1 hypothetical protein TQ38_010300 [Novosphingobium sp. P6W]KIS33319.1 hypothetical protein TQ38_07830 [Novosphingobium sp. P6W]